MAIVTIAVEVPELSLEYPSLATPTDNSGRGSGETEEHSRHKGLEKPNQEKSQIQKGAANK